MKRFHKSWALATILVAALSNVLAPRAAAQTGSISGSIMDVNGKPWAEGVIRSVSDQEKQAKADLQKAPPDQRNALKQKLADLSDQAVKEFQEAAKSLGEKDPNAHLVWFKLGEAYDTAGRNEDAAQAYQQAINAKPDVPGYYNNMGNVLARAGKIEEAKAADTKSAELDPPNAATAWRTFGISLDNANRLGD